MKFQIFKQTPRRSSSRCKYSPPKPCFLSPPVDCTLLWTLYPSACPLHFSGSPSPSISGMLRLPSQATEGQLFPLLSWLILHVELQGQRQMCLLRILLLSSSCRPLALSTDVLPTLSSTFSHCSCSSVFSRFGHICCSGWWVSHGSHTRVLQEASESYLEGWCMSRGFPGIDTGLGSSKRFGSQVS